MVNNKQPGGHKGFLKKVNVMGPDFICIGLQKGGSRWLHDQLRCAKGVWMPPVKEINYFHRRSFKPGNLKALSALQKLKSCTQSLHPFRDLEFFKSFEKGRSPECYSDDWYLSLFSHKGNYISGDISPGYSALGADEVSNIAGFLPDAKVLLLLRHPVDRFKSALSMTIRKGKFSEADICSVDRMKRIIRRRSFIRKSFPSQIWRRWTRYFGAERCRYFFLEEIREQPERVRSRIAEFINLRNPRFRLPARFNRKSGNRRYSCPAEIEDLLYRHFKDEILQCREIFKGPALDWKTQV